MTLEKPPIVEMWIEFKFDPSPDTAVERAIKFLQNYAKDFPELEVSQENRLEFRHVSPKKLPELWGSVAVKHLRAQDGNGSRWMHLTPTQLVCNYLRLGEVYPGFQAMSEETVEKLKYYVEVCQPVKLLKAAIHYVDVIEVPIPDKGEIQLADYFVLGVDLPAKPFGNQLSFLVRTEVDPPDRTGPLEIQLQFDSILREQNAFRFRMDWHKVCPYDGEIDFARVSSNLGKAHASVMECFPQAFTKAGWKLFSPKS